MKTLILLLGVLSASVVQLTAAERPNIILILADDLGWSDTTLYGTTKLYQTPNIERLAKRGMTFTRAYAVSPLCSPTRASLLTGQHPARHGITTPGCHSLEEHLKAWSLPNGPAPSKVTTCKSATRLDTAHRTLAEALKKEGYATGHFGKWHLGPEPFSPLEHGFDVDIPHTPTAGPPGGYFGWSTETMKPNTPREHIEDRMAAEACAFIERNHARPFFLYLAYSGPHTPLEATPERLARFPGKMPERRRTALAMLATIDDGVGQIMSKLRKHGLEENTLVVFTSDNGAPLKMTMPDAPLTKGPDGKQNDIGGWDGSINAPQLGEKGMLTEGGIREPFLWSWRGVLPAGKVYDHPVSSLDIASTMLAAAGIAERDGLDGVNVLPHLTGTIATPPHEALYWRFWKQAAVRAGDWKLIHLGDGTDFLFGLSQPDPETKNLAAEHPDKVAELRTKLDAWTQQLRPPGLPKNGIQRERQWYQHFLHHAAASPP